MKIVILGGTGLIGSKVVNLLRARGHELVAASPSQGINSITGQGLTEALRRSRRRHWSQWCADGYTRRGMRAPWYRSDRFVSEVPIKSDAP